MIDYVLIALIASAVGAFIMKSISEYLRWTTDRKIVNEEPHFKDQYLRYYTRKLDDGTIEFWAFPVVSRYGDNMGRSWEWELEQYGHGDGFLLGRLVNEELVKPSHFYSYPANIQRGAIRLYKTVGVYHD